MTNENNISGFQIMILTFSLVGSLFVGYGNTILFLESGHDAWIIALIAMFLGLILLFLLFRIINYKKSLNILDKNKLLYGRTLGSIFNLAFMVIIIIILVISLVDFGAFVNFKYLYETPYLFICLFLMIPAIYASICGIETIVRTVQILFYLNILILIIVFTVLIPKVDIQNIKPILVGDINTYINSGIKFITYSILPLITLLVIPKDKIKDNKEVFKKVIAGYILGSMVIIGYLFFTTGVLGEVLLKLYNFPEYHLVKKISMKPFDNLENFLSLHWSMNLFTVITLGLYFLKEYLVGLFKMVNKKRITVMTIILGIVIPVVSLYIYPSLGESFDFVRYNLITYIGIPLLIFILMSNIVISLKNNKI